MDDRGAGVKHLVNIFRRLHRIFAHAWFQHRDVFWQVEGHTGLYVLFKTVCDRYELLPAENYKLPPEAEGLEPVEEIKAPQHTILKAEVPVGNVMTPIEEDFISVGRTNTRRHIRQNPSVGSAVTTVMESDEEDPDVAQRLGELHIADEEGESEGGTEIPVIVESYEADAKETAMETSPDSQTPVTNNGSKHWEGTLDSNESKPTSTDDSFETSSTISWDRPSSETMVESEPQEPTTVILEEAHLEPQDKEDGRDTALAPETETEEEPHVEEGAPALEAEVKKKAEDES